MTHLVAISIMLLYRDPPQRWTPTWYLAFLLIAVLIIPVATFQVNRTIDDEYGDLLTNLKVDYTSGWNFGPNCRVCILRVMPPTSAVNSTWHDAQTLPGGQNESFTLIFPGTAIYVYGIIPNAAQITQESIDVNLTFLLDGEPSGPPFFSPALGPGDPDFKFDVPVYTKTGLANQIHTLKVSLSPGTNQSVFTGFLFDYATYTFEGLPAEYLAPSTCDNSTHLQSETPTPRHSTPVVAIVTGAVGWFLFLAVSSIFGWFWRIQRQRIYALSSKEEKVILDPYSYNYEQNPSNQHSPPVQFMPTQATTTASSRSMVASRTNGALPTEDQPLRDQIAVLQAEMEALRSQNLNVSDMSEVRNPPPQYLGPGPVDTTITTMKRQ